MDQFEEVFTSCHDDDERLAYVRALVAACTSRGNNGLPDSIPSATSRNPLRANTSSMSSLARWSTLIRPVASQTAQSPTRSVVNAAIMVSITRRAPRNRSSTTGTLSRPARAVGAAAEIVMRWDRECDGTLEEVAKIPVLRIFTFRNALATGVALFPVKRRLK